MDPRTDHGAWRSPITADCHDDSFVHEYGGRPFAVRAGIVWYCNRDGQRVWRRLSYGTTTPVTARVVVDTGQVMRDLDLRVQFWTARGFAVVAPNSAGRRGTGAPIGSGSVVCGASWMWRTSSIRRALEAELSFYGQVWGITAADDVEPVEVHHLG